MKNNRLIRIFIAVSIALIPLSVFPDTVKRSKNGICHDTNSPYYARVKNYIPYETIGQCLASGGRLPKDLQLGKSTAKAPAETRRKTSFSNDPGSIGIGDSYSRHKFGSWIDTDHDCLNTRHELLMKLSTGPVTKSSPCAISRGRWIDPYSKKVFYDASDVDIDHLVPLKWAWEHGADNWSQEKRIQFANDERNLFVVEDSLNQSKGALDPTQWLPPSTDFQCQYLVRYIRIMKMYALKLSQIEEQRFSELRHQLCYD